jgi:hypothetical protein
VLPLSHVLPCFPNLILSSLHLLIFRHPYFTHIKSDCRNFGTMNFALYFFHIYPFYWKISIGRKISWFQTLTRVTSFLRYPLIEIFFLIMNMTFASYKTLDFESWLYNLPILIFFSYFRPIHLISIELQNIDNNSALHQIFISFHFNCYNIAIRAITLTKIFSANYQNSKV